MFIGPYGLEGLRVFCWLLAGKEAKNKNMELLDIWDSIGFSESSEASCP